ncbi:hypothetical protein AGMMS49950_11340 [Endomicrobiia bacterium]|nr:hypothetical protein AGMMS49531_10520 [Endomicrobiia bacterium]GHT72809.1 hypothetical protein AGMMS49950_11340 [Endomicrobiia bacterium]
MEIGIVKGRCRSRSSSNYATDVIQRPKKNSESGESEKNKDIQ